MQHVAFAYPNVTTRDIPLGTAIAGGRFLGCGRYLSVPQGPPPRANYIPAQPRTPNRDLVQAAAMHLAPELRGATARIYEGIDEPAAAPYCQGASLDLAYLLALIRCVYPLWGELECLDGDLWCTGAIQLVDGRLPFLKYVESPGFDLKVQAFLRAPERLFLVPAANLSLEHKALLTCQAVQWGGPSALRHLDFTSSPGSSPKTVIAIQADELPVVIDLLFERSVLSQDGERLSSKKQTRKDSKLALKTDLPKWQPFLSSKKIIGLILFVLFGVGVVFFWKFLHEPEMVFPQFGLGVLQNNNVRLGCLKTPFLGQIR